MRNSTNLHNDKRRGFVGALKVATAVVLFLLIFTGVLLASHNLDFASAEKTRPAGKTDDVTSIGINGVTLVDSSSNNDGIWGARFGISGDFDTATNGFGWNSSSNGGWGYTDFKNVDKQGVVYWLEFALKDEALAAVKEGRVSFYASASSDFSDGNDDATGMGISYGGVHEEPAPKFIKGSSSKREDYWSDDGKKNLAHYERDRFHGWDGAWNDYSASKRTYNIGTDGSFDATYVLPDTAQSIRIVFAVVCNGNIDGGYKNITLKLFEKPNDVISSSGMEFDLTKSLYGDEYKVQAIGTNHWSPKNSGHSTDTYFYPSEKNACNIGSQSKDYVDNVEKKEFKAGAQFGDKTLSCDSVGVLNEFGNNKANATTYIITIVKLPKGVTHIDFSADLLVSSYKHGGGFPPYTANHEATVTVDLLDKDVKAISGASKSVATGPHKSDATHAETGTAEFTHLKVYDSAPASDTLLIIRLRLDASQDDAGGWSDNGNAYGLIGNIKIKMYGEYYVNYNGSGATGGSTANQTFRYGIKDSKETLNANGFTYGTNTFVGWANVENGPVVYKETYTYSGSTVTATTYDTSDGASGDVGSFYTTWSKEMTRVPGQTINLYAVWVDSDFGVLSGKSRGSDWGSASNPFVIQNLSHWNNLRDIVERSREPVDSVTGNYYGKVRTTQAVYTSFNGCYFALATDLNLGTTTPLGVNTEASASDAFNFKGTIYGGNGAYSATKSLKTVSCDISTEGGSAGLFSYLNGATVEYIKVTGTICNFSGANYAGGIAGQIAGTTAIRNCESQVNVINASIASTNTPTAHDGAGGIVGYVSAGATTTIENCKYAGGSKYYLENVDKVVCINNNIYGANFVGGIVGKVENGKFSISGCSSSGDIRGFEAVGGIAGQAITNLSASGSGKISHCYNSATVSADNTGHSTVGGIVGYFAGGTGSGALRLEYCYNGGSIIGKGQNVGGIVGNSSGGNYVSIEYCYNTGATSGSSAVDGVKGAGNGNVANSWAFYTQKSADVNFAGVPVGASPTGGKAIIALANSSGKVTDYVRPSDASNSVTCSWDNITDATKQFTKFLIFPTAYSVAKDSHLMSFRNDANKTMVMPSYSNNAVNAGGVNVINMVYDANLGVSYLGISVRSINTKTTAQTVEYGSRITDPLVWVSNDSSAYQNKNCSNALVLEYSKNGSNWISATADEVRNVFFEGGSAKRYYVRVSLKNNGECVGVRVISGDSTNGYLITRKRLNITQSPAWNGAFSNSYIYNREAQGLSQLLFDGFISGETVASVFDVAFEVKNSIVSDFTHSVTANAVNVETVAQGNYSVTLNQKLDNYETHVINGSDIQKEKPIKWDWTIVKKDISNPATFNADSYDVFFGYGADGIASGAHTFDVNGKSLYALDMRKWGVFYGAGDSPFALIYKDASSVYTNIQNFGIYVKTGDNFHKTVYNTDFSVTVRKGVSSISGNTINYSALNLNEVELEFKGINNYQGSRTIRFTLMESDFGGKFGQASYGSQSNPYLIQSRAHLVRLSQIVAGDPAWNSIYSTDSSVAFALNEHVSANVVSRDYKNGYFYIAGNISVSTAQGFIPVGVSATNAFSGFIDGYYQSAQYAVTLNASSEGDYVGLFGYLKGATVRNIVAQGSVRGRDYVAGIAGFADSNTVFEGSLKNYASATGRFFVGGVVGLLNTNLSGAQTGDNDNKTPTVKGARAVGGIVGGIVETSKTVAVSNCYNYGKVAYVANSATAPDIFNFTDRDRGLSANGLGGIVGFVKINKDARVIDCINYESGSDYRVDGAGAYGIGGVVGLASATGCTLSIEATAESTTGNRARIFGSYFVGGIAGYAENVRIEENCRVNGWAVSDGEYLGGIAGKWIVNDKSQMAGQRKVTSNITIDGEKYVGGLVGWLDARNALGLKLTPYITNGKPNPIKVNGKSYVGVLYGGIEGAGYKKNSRNASDNDTVVYIGNQSSGDSIYAQLTLESGGYVAGGLIGYVSGAGILFLGDWTGINYTPVNILGRTDFFGGVIGVLGENAVISSAETVSGGETLGGVTHTLRYRDTQSGIIKIEGDFIGSVVGYIASSAGAFLSQGTTLMGNGIKLYNYSRINAGSFVGGIFGAVGRISDSHYNLVGGRNDYVFNDTYFVNLLRYGAYGATATGANVTLRYATSDDKGLGKLINYSQIVCSGDYVGGLVGYAGDNCLLALFNPVVSGGSGITYTNVSTYLNVYNGYGEDPTSATTANIKGANYVGGIAGYLSASSHEMTRVVNVMRIIANKNGVESSYDYDGSYAGGLFGYMGGGTVNGSIAINGYASPDEAVNGFMGREYVGGLVGMLAGGTVNQSVSRGFRFASVDVTRGGVVGSVNAGTTITASWTFYLVNDPTYATFSRNTNGHHIILDRNLIIRGSLNYSPTFSEYARMVGLFSSSFGNMTNRASDNAHNPTKAGYLSFRTPLPAKNTQIVYYDASGSDVASKNRFEIHKDSGEIVYHRFDMNATDNFSVCIKSIDFKNIPKKSANEATNKTNVADSYIKPASDGFYYVDVQSLTYNADDNIEYAGGTAMCSGNGSGAVKLGTFEKTFTPGDSSTPFIIANQTDWNNFATSIRSGSNTYQGQFVKLAPEGNTQININLNNLAGLRNSSANVFKGTFDGDGNTLNIQIQVDSTKPAELSGASAFPNASGAKFKNLTIKGYIGPTNELEEFKYVNDNDDENAANVAGFVGKPTGNLRFENCTNLVNIKAQRTVGGIVGYTNNNIITLVSCVNKGNIDVADKEIGDYLNYNYGTGGIIGYADREITIESCKNEGNIRGGYNVGGIIGQNDNKTNIYNCANSGEVFADAFWSSEQEYADKKGSGTYRLTYAGGVIGKIGPKGYLNMLACYNSGKVVGFGTIVGGLAGSVGILDMEGQGDPNASKAGGKSVIAYCYNTGDVYASGTKNENGHVHRSVSYSLVGREELNGSVVGGIVGFIAWGDIKYCYNTGKITTYRVMGYSFSWQARIGGIAGQVQPMAKDETHRCYFFNCYNLGVIEIIGATEFVLGGMDVSGTTKVNWGAGILGYIDNESKNEKIYEYVSRTDCYSVANCVHTRIVDEKTGNLEGNKDRWSSGIMTGDENQGRYIEGTTTIDINGSPQNLTVEHFTAYMNNEGKLKVDQPIGGSSNCADNNSAASLITSSGISVANYNGADNVYDSNFLDGSLYGYVYIYGCLPQLAVFALDTKEGLSMLSVSYGRNDYNEFVGNQAGSKESPYVVKDGVGLLAMSALTGAKNGSAKYSFEGKYIEFADGANNINSDVARYINMDMSSANSLKSGKTQILYNGEGKNYFLWREGAASGNTSIRRGGSPESADTIRGRWIVKNYYYNGKEYANGADFVANANFYPIGSVGAEFKGSLSGKQGENDNTEIKNLKISVLSKYQMNSTAGLFGSVYGASVSYISVDGTVNAYAYSDTANFRSFAGGIAGYVGGNSVVDHCSAGGTNPITVTAYAVTQSATSPKSTGYAGGIAGAVGPSRLGGSAESFNTLTVSECRSANATVKSLKSGAGGIVGYIGDIASATGEGNYVNLKNVYVYNSSVTTLENVTNSDPNSNDLAGVDIGGIAGTCDGKAIFVLDGGYVGIAPDYVYASALTVSVKGENSVGGAIGTARGNTEIRNVEVGEATSVVREKRGTAQNVVGGLYHTSIGGVIGRTLENTSNILRDKISFNGKIEVNVANDDSNPTANIGGVIGAMEEGTRFLSGSTVTVTGQISTTLTSNVRNIGGVVGASLDGAFDGTFTVSPKISAQSAVYIGGFIGRNIGTSDILSSDTGTTIFIEADIIGQSQVGGIVGLNGYTYTGEGTVTGALLIGADTYKGGRYEGSVSITVSDKAKIQSLNDDAGGLIGKNEASGAGLGLVITKGTILNKGTVLGLNNVGGIIGHNEGDITMGGSSVASAVLRIVNEGNVKGGTYSGASYVGDGNNVGGVIGYLVKGSIAGTFENKGNVTGGKFVGGSIGRLDSEAVLTVNGSQSTNFINGAEVADDSSIGGNVTGKMYVGGSIGALFGEIAGTAGARVIFDNYGVVNGDVFVGGNIGLLAGGVRNAQFVCNGRVIASGANAIGGSVGYIGITTEYDAVSYAHRPISVINVHFEFVAKLSGGDKNSIVVRGSEPAGKSEFNWGGVGGSIGVIGGTANGFSNGSGSPNWKNVSLYAEGSIDASQINNVGGAIGLIMADYIAIDNMLAFYTSVKGKRNVGGIVGAITGLNARINNSFNIEGTVTGDPAGGIVGRAVGDGSGKTVANTSYWVKGYRNAELMALDLNTIVRDLGKYVALADSKTGTVFTEDLTKLFDTPAKYTGNPADGENWMTYLNKVAGGKTVKLVNGVYATEQSATGYTTGTESTGWYYVFANDRSGLDTTHINAKDSSKPSVLAEDERAGELKYWKRIANAYTADERNDGQDTATLPSPIAGSVNGTSVQGGGYVNSGRIYARALESQSDGYYLYMDATGDKKPDIYYSSSAGDDGKRPFYLIANTALVGGKNAQNVAVYYRSVGIGRTLTYNGYDRFAPITATVGNGKTINYVSGDVPEKGTPGEYAYTVTTDTGAVLKNICEVGDYVTNVSIYYYDANGTCGRIGGITGAKFSIGKMMLETSLTASNGTYDGDNTGGEIVLTINGIAPKDYTALRPVKFKVTGQVAGQISGTLDLSKIMEGGRREVKIAPSDRVTAKDYADLTSDRIYLSYFKVETSPSVDKIDWDTSCIGDPEYKEGAKPYKVTVRFKFLGTMTDTLSMELDTSESGGRSKNYSTNPSPLTVAFNISPKALELKLGAESVNDVGYDGVSHTTSYEFVGWVENVSTPEDKTALIASLLPYLQYTSLDEDSQNKVIGDATSTAWDITKTGGNTMALTQDGKAYFEATWQIANASIHLAKMKEKGKYYVKFNKERVYEVDGAKYMLTDGGNYYVKVPAEKDQPATASQLFRITPNEFTVKWVGTTTAQYNALYHYLSASFEAKHPFGNADIIADEIATLLPVDMEDGEFVIEKVDSKNVILKFRVGPNAGTHTVKLPATSTENCAIKDPTDGTFTITKLKITVKFSGDSVAVYNGASHEAQSIAVDCPADASAKPAYKFSPTAGEYTITMFGDLTDKNNEDKDNQVTVTLLYKSATAETQYAVNVGKYTAKIGTVRPAGADNFVVEADASGELTITPANISFKWDDKDTFVYDANKHGRDITATVSGDWGDEQKLTGSLSYDPANDSYATLTITNAYNKTETVKLPVSGNGMINARSTTYKAVANTGGITITGQNRFGATNETHNNYNITFADSSNGSYTIKPRVMEINGISGSSFNKTYDATTAVKNTSWTVSYTDPSVKPSSSNITITAVYDSANVGNRIITFTVTIKAGSNDANNFTFTNATTRTTYKHSGTINARKLTVSLDMLRSMRATKTYNGNALYGGAGATSMAGSATAQSAIHRLGEGFIVKNIAEAETGVGAVIITARFKEAEDGRDAFDGYVNNVIGTGADLKVANTQYGDDDYFYKNLVFTLSGTSASNYTFAVVKGSDVANIGTGAGKAGDGNGITVSGKSSGIEIEITPLTARASYSNTAQSYATADNTYNTNWKNVSGSVYAVGGDVLSLDVVNNWQFVGNNPANGVREYRSYTVIRGGVNSTVLSAKLKSNSGAHVNYRLGNQPILTIGYFVDKEEFEISSIAGLMIATYYYSASKSGGNEFGVISQVKWHFIVSEDDFFDNANLPANNNGVPFVDADGNPIEITCWDDYFEWLERTEGIEVIFNNSEAQAGWGYYSADKNGASGQTFTKFRQTANISGVLTSADVAILNGMFKKTVVSEDGSVDEGSSYDWGVGAKYLPNFLKLGAGNVATAKGSVFPIDFDGSYDGAGYVIDSLNIVGVASGDTYVGMFGRILEKAQVKNLHLRNVNITVSGSGNVYVGALAGESRQTSLANVSAHATINVNTSATAHVGGLIGISSSKLNGVIALGNIKVKAGTAHVGGIAGRSTSATVDNAVSLAEIWSVASTAYVGGLLGTDSTSTLGGAHEFMQNSVWSNRSAITGGLAYTQLYNKSISGYGSTSKYYYTGDSAGAKGDLDVLSDVKLVRMDGEANSKSNPRESMRLADIINVYVLMYATANASVNVEGVSVAVFSLSSTSWLVGRAHGTDNDGDAIVIANQQGIALMRELRFATFTLANDVYMYSTYRLQTASGAFYGKVRSNNFAIYIATYDGSQQAFEKEVGADTPTAVIKKA